jgi:hypothetical protein
LLIHQPYFVRSDHRLGASHCKRPLLTNCPRLVQVRTASTTAPCCGRSAQPSGRRARRHDGLTHSSSTRTLSDRALRQNIRKHRRRRALSARAVSFPRSRAWEPRTRTRCACAGRRGASGAVFGRKKIDQGQFYARSIIKVHEVAPRSDTFLVGVYSRDGGANQPAGLTGEVMRSTPGKNYPFCFASWALFENGFGV